MMTQTVGTDLLLFGNKRAVEPIKSVPTTALDATLGSMAPKSVALAKHDEGPRFLDTYSEADLRGFFNSFRFATGRYTGKNFNEMFAQLGFTHLIFNIDVSDNFVHRVSLYDTAQCPENLLAQFVKTSNTPFFDDRTVGHECCAMETDSLSEGKQRSVFSTPKALTRKLQGSQSIMRMALRKGCRICVAISMGAT